MSVGESLTSTWQWNSIFGREVSKTNKSTKERERMDKTGNAGLEIDPHSPLRRRLCPEIHALVSFDIIKRRQGERERVVPSQPPVYSLWWIICFPVFQKNNEGRRLCDITSRHSDALILSWGRPSGHRCRLLWFVNKSTEKNGAHAAWHNWQRTTWWQPVNRLLCLSFLRSAASQSVRNMRYLFQLLPCCAKWAIYSTAACIIMEIWQCSRWAIGATEGAHISGRAAALKKKTIMAVESTCCCCCWFARRSWRCVISLTDSGLFIFMNFSVRFWWPRH